MCYADVGCKHARNSISCGAEKAANGTRPLHAIMGAGDQLYNDNLWILPPLQEWLKRDDKLEYKPDKTMQEAISGYYCGAYLRHTHYHPAAPLLRNTPQVRLHTAACSSPQRLHALLIHAATATR